MFYKFHNSTCSSPVYLHTVACCLVWGLYVAVGFFQDPKSGKNTVIKRPKIGFIEPAQTGSPPGLPGSTNSIFRGAQSAPARSNTGATFCAFTSPAGQGGALKRAGPPPKTLPCW